MAVAPQRHLVDDPGVRLGLGGLLLIATTMIVVGLGLSDAEAAVILLGVALGVSLVVTRPMALLTGVTAWCLYDGFALHDYGQLVLGAADLRLLVAFTLLSLGGGHGARMHTVRNGQGLRE